MKTKIDWIKNDENSNPPVDKNNSCRGEICSRNVLVTDGDFVMTAFRVKDVGSGEKVWLMSNCNDEYEYDNDTVLYWALLPVLPSK